MEVKKSWQLETDLDASIILTKFNRNLAKYNKITFHGVIENILTLGVRVPGSNPGGSKKVGSWKLIWINQNYSNKNRNLASTTKLASVV